MAQQTINTVIVLRNDSTTEWASSDYKLLPGEVGVGYMTRDLGNGNTKQVPIIKVGDGENTWKDLPQAEGVFEDNLTLTYNFGKHKTSNGSVDAGGKGMTTSEWLLDALSEILNPTITYPTASLQADGVETDTGDKEVGSYITKIKWKTTTTNGTYTGNDGTGTYGSSGGDTNATGITSGNFTWSVANNKNSTTSDKTSGSFSLTEAERPRIDSESSKTYAKLSGSVTLDASGAYTQKNNLGKVYETGKIAGFDASGDTDIDFSDIAVNATGFRKPFWGVLTAPLTIATLTSDQVRGLSGKGTTTQGFPTTLAVAAGSRQVIFCAKKDAYKSLTAKDTAAMNAGVTFTKHAAAVSVKGVNDYTATEYDVWEVTWADPIASAKSLALTWTK
jgi:hypothetical protein